MMCAGRCPHGWRWEKAGPSIGALRCEEGLGEGLREALPNFLHVGSSEVAGLGESVTGDSWTKVTEVLGRKPGVIGAMAGDSDGNVWFAFSNKLVEWDGSTYHRFSFPDGTLNISVAVVSVRGDHIWLGGSGGVALFSHGRFNLMHWNDDRNPGRVSGLLETEAGELWLNGTSGVIRVPADELKRWLNDSEYGVSADRFDLQDGLPGLAEERWPEPSLVESSSGILWFSTTKGIVWIDQSKLGGTRNRIPPPVFVNNVVDKGKIYSGTNGPLALPAKGNLEFNYTALSLAIPGRVLFRYNNHYRGKTITSSKS